jgi:hypothetical protein
LGVAFPLKVLAFPIHVTAFPCIGALPLTQKCVPVMSLLGHIKRQTHNILSVVWSNTVCKNLHVIFGIPGLGDV